MIKESFGHSLEWETQKRQALGWECPERETWAKHLTSWHQWLLLSGAGGLAEVLSVAAPSTEQVLSDHSFPYFFPAQVSRLFCPGKLEVRWTCVRRAC